jgi:hypothetical protein
LKTPKPVVPLPEMETQTESAVGATARERVVRKSLDCMVWDRLLNGGPEFGKVEAWGFAVGEEESRRLFVRVVVFNSLRYCGPFILGELSVGIS